MSPTAARSRVGIARWRFGQARRAQALDECAWIAAPSRSFPIPRRITALPDLRRYGAAASAVTLGRLS